jgi:DNA transformation protein and related proteins
MTDGSSSHATRKLAEMRGLGSRSVQLLEQVGIGTPQALRAVGAVDAYERLVRAGLPVSLNMLWALEGALSDRDWRAVAREDRTALLAELDRRGIAP